MCKAYTRGMNRVACYESHRAVVRIVGAKTFLQLSPMKLVSSWDSAFNRQLLPVFTCKDVCQQANIFGRKIMTYSGLEPAISRSSSRTLCKLSCSSWYEVLNLRYRQRHAFIILFVLKQKTYVLLIFVKLYASSYQHASIQSIHENYYKVWHSLVFAWINITRVCAM